MGVPEFIGVTEFRRTARKLEEYVRATAATTANVILSEHALERMVERGIEASDVYRILRAGSISGQPELTDRGEQKCKMVLELRGRRSAGVVTIILENGMLFVKTVEWEDL